MRALQRFLWGRDSEAGQAIMIVAGSMTVMVLMVGLAIDVGQLFSSRRTMQEAADAGAYAGAVVIYQGGTSEQALAQAVADVTRNGFTDGDDGGNTTVTVRVPTSGAHSGNDDYVEVLITARVDASLMSVVGANLTTVTVRAVAGSEPLNNGYAVMSLESGNVQNALAVSQNGNIDITGAGILVNSTHTQAAYNADSDGSNISIDPCCDLDVAGGTAGGWGTADVDTGEPQQTNPFAGYPKPSTSGMTTYSAIPADSADGANDNVHTIYPGIYTTEIGVSGTKYIKMMPGVYIMKAGMNATGNATICTTVTVDPSATPACSGGTNGGVFLYNTGVNYSSSPVGDCDAINLNGNGKSTLFPMTTGTYAGMLVYQDEACADDLTISGNGELEASGTIYLPGADFVMNGNNATLTGSQVVSLRVDVQNGNLALTFDASTTAQPVLPRLAE